MTSSGRSVSSTGRGASAGRAVASVGRVPDGVVGDPHGGRGTVNSLIEVAPSSAWEYVTKKRPFTSNAGWKARPSRPRSL